MSLSRRLSINILGKTSCKNIRLVSISCGFCIAAKKYFWKTFCKNEKVNSHKTSAPFFYPTAICHTGNGLFLEERKGPKRREMAQLILQLAKEPAVAVSRTNLFLFDFPSRSHYQKQASNGRHHNKKKKNHGFCVWAKTHVWKCPKIGYFSGLTWAQVGHPSFLLRPELQLYLGLPPSSLPLSRERKRRRPRTYISLLPVSPGIFHENRLFAKQEVKRSFWIEGVHCSMHMETSRSMLWQPLNN